MTLDEVIKRFENRQPATSATSANFPDVALKAAQNKGCTSATSATSKKTILDLHSTRANPTREAANPHEQRVCGDIDPENIIEYYEERAAILEYDGGLSRHEAEAEALNRTIVKYRLNEFYGAPPIQGGGTLVGGPGQSIDELTHHLREKYGPRLA